MREKEPRAHAKGHRDRQVEEVVHDPYMARNKPPEPDRPECGLVYHKGRWQRAAAGQGAHAAFRVRGASASGNRFPAGYVKLSGDFLGAHRDEIRHLIRNEEQQEATNHPLQRIMDITEEGGVASATTTDVHLARRIGEALHHAYQGKLDQSTARTKSTSCALPWSVEVCKVDSVAAACAGVS